MQSRGCHIVSEQLTASRASEDDVKQVSQIMVCTVQQLEAGEASLAPNPEDHGHPWDDMGSDDETDPDTETPGFNGMSVEGQEAVQRRHHKRKRLAVQRPRKKTVGKAEAHIEKVQGTSRILRWFWSYLVPGLHRVGEAGDPGPFCARANLFSAQHEGI